MASAWSGQPALCQLPSVPTEENGKGPATLESYVPPDCLWATKRGGADSKKTGFGIFVYKVASNGKIQPRRLAISSDNRTILISSAKIQSKIKSVKNLFKDSSSQTDGGVAARRIDISSIDSIHRGQQTGKFFLSKDGGNVHAVESNDEKDEGSHSLSIVYHVASATHSAFDLSYSGANSASRESLDLTVPSREEYQALTTTLEEIVHLYKVYRSNVHRDVLLLQHYWIDMGKTCEKSISASEWISICVDGLGVPMQKAYLQSLYEKHCQDIGADAGLKLHQAVWLLNTVRDRTLLKADLCVDIEDIDPCNRVWKRIRSVEKKRERLAVERDKPATEESDGVEKCHDSPKAVDALESKIDMGVDEIITAEQFLRFLHDEQNDVSTSMNEVYDLFSRLNANVLSSSFSPGEALGLLRNDPPTVDGDGEQEICPSIPKDRITKSIFFHFLMSDANDIFDPSSGICGKNDMSQPLSSYWINTSYKIYMAGNGKCKQDVVQAYLTALQRGCRCLELDVWDGQGIHSNVPVVRQGKTLHSEEEKSDISLLDSILLEDVLRIVRSFLQSQPRSYPVILSLENHCTVPYQDKVASQLQDILGVDDVLYNPPGSLTELKSLPSPESLRGKVIIKSKRPRHDAKSAAVVNDDFDDENDFDPQVSAQHHAVEIDDEDAEEEIVVGFRSDGSIISEFPSDVERTPQELLEIAEKEADDAKRAADLAEKQAFDLAVEANKAEKHATALANEIGLTYQELEEERGQLGMADVLQERQGDALSNSPQLSKPSNSEPSSSNDEGTTGTFSPVSGSTSSDTNPSKDFFDHLRSSTLGSGTDLGGTSSLGSGTDLGRTSPHASGSADEGWLRSFNLGRDLFAPLSSETQGTRNTGCTERTDEQLEQPKRSTNEGAELNTESRKTGAKLSPKNADEDGGVEVQDFFFESVTQAEAWSAKADEDAAKAGEAEARALCKFQEVSEALAKAEDALYGAVTKKRDLSMAADRAAAEARANHEHAETAKQRVLTVQQLKENCSNQAKSAETVAATAATEAEISEHRAVEAEKRAEKAQTVAKKNREMADAETKKEEDLGKEALDLQAKYEEVTAIYRKAREMTEKVAMKLGRIEDDVKKIEESPTFITEYSKATEDHPEDEEIVVLPGSMLAKHKAKMVEMKACLEEVRETAAEKASAEKSRRRYRQLLQDMHHKIKEQGKVASVARKQADKSTSLADQMAEYAEEEREAANMRKIALDKAVACVEKSSTHGASVDSQLLEAERAAAEAIELASKSRISAEKLAKAIAEVKDTIAEKVEVDILKEEEEKAAIARDAARAVKKKADDTAAEARRRMETNRELFDKAKQDSAAEVNRVKADKTMKERVIAAHCDAVELRQQAENAKKEATAAVNHASNKKAAERHAKKYRDKKVRVKPVSQRLEQLTLIHSRKFVNLEKSSVLPFWHMHSISEGLMLHLVGQGPSEIKQWKAFNKANITRVFPSRHEHVRSSSGNLNPILPWTMGCQMVSIDCQASDVFSFLNDGRFRENGSCGYVLKPEQLAEDFTAAGEDCPHDEIQIDVPRKLNVKLLSGCNLPKPESGAKGTISLRVRIALFDGASVDGSESPPIHVTTTVKNNRLNPVWNEGGGASFVASKPSVAMVLFSVWNARDSKDTDDFIAAAAVPVSSLRQGYRSVQLFDSTHSRRGAYSFASLLVHVSTKH